MELIGVVEVVEITIPGVGEGGEAEKEDKTGRSHAETYICVAPLSTAFFFVYARFQETDAEMMEDSRAQDRLHTGGEMDPTGRLFLIPVPLGNIEDLAPRSAGLLSTLPVLLCEDTRTTSKLLAKLELHCPSLLPVHDHNERSRTSMVLRKLAEGDVGMVSEAGTPVISDPGFLVVKAAIEAGHEVVSVPGPNAAIAALVASGLPADRFLFVGFPPRSEGKRQTWLGELCSETGSLILYESPRRIVALLRDVVTVLGERPVAVAFNISKKGERVVRGTVSEVVSQLNEEGQIRGEITLVVGGAPPDDTSNQWQQAELAIDALVSAGTPAKVVRDVLSSLLDLPKRELYQRVLDRRQGDR